MRAVVAALAVVLMLPGLAHAAAPASMSSLEEPLQPVPSLSDRPIVTGVYRVRFTTTAAEALVVAEAAPAMQALHRREHPLQYQIDVWSGANPDWEVYFSYRGAVVADVQVSPAGVLRHVWTGPLALTATGRGHLAGLFDSPLIVLTFAVLFLVPFVDPQRLRHPAPLDALLLLAAFGVPYYLFNNTHFVASVLLVYPFLLAVIARMLWLGLRDRPRAGPEPRWPMPMLVAGLVVLVVARIVLDLIGPKVIDVGVASVMGAHAIAHGQALYGTAPDHADTYGPIVYLAYLPFELIWRWNGGYGFVPAAHAAAVVFDLATVAGLIVLGRRLRPGPAGRRLGLTLAWAWCAYPVSLFALMNNTNDGLVSLLFVILLLVATSPTGRGAIIGLAAAAKLFPAILLPLFARARPGRGRRDAAITAAVFALVVVAAFAPFVPSGGLHELYARTLGFQIGRPDEFSVWGQHPALKWLQRGLEVLVCAGAAATLWLSPRRSLAALAALAAAITLAVQLPAEHWFYFYLDWAAPFVLVALLARPDRFQARPGRVR